MISKKRLVTLGLLPVLTGIAAASLVAIGSRPSQSSEASSHREAPAISGDPLADATDTYAFIAPDAPDKLTLVGNWIPLEEPAGGPNFYNFGDDVTYDFDIDNNGDAKEDVVYRFKFHTQVLDPTTFLYATGPITSLDDPNFNIRQSYDVYRKEGRGDFQLVASNLRTPPNNIGPRSTPDYDSVASQAIYSLPGGGKVFAGQRDDPFFVDLGAVFDLATIRQLPGNNGGGIDNVAGFNTNSIVLQVPVASVTACKCDSATPSPGMVVGVWTETYRNKVTVLKGDGSQNNDGPLVRVSRLGNPLVNEVVIPLAKKDAFNASKPKDDAQFGPFVLHSDLAQKLNAVYSGIVTPIPEDNRTDLATVFLTGIPGLNQPADVKPSEQLRINLGIKPASCGPVKRLGVIAGDNCGFPNGRRLADDSTDVEIRAVACGYGFNLGPCVDSAPNNLLGDGVDQNDKPFLTSFPYVASPWSGFASPHNTSPVPPLMAGIGAGSAAVLALVLGSAIAGRIRRRKATDPAA